MFCFTCSESKISSAIKKSQNIMNMVDNLFRLIMGCTFEMLACNEPLYTLGGSIVTKNGDLNRNTGSLKSNLYVMLNESFRFLRL